MHRIQQKGSRLYDDFLWWNFCHLMRLDSGYWTVWYAASNGIHLVLGRGFRKACQVLWHGFLGHVCKLPEALPGKREWKGVRRQLYTVLKCMHLNSSSGFNGFQNKAAGKSSRLFSRKVLVGEGYSKFSPKGISLLPLPVESLDCSPTLPSILCAHLKLELL